MEKIMNTPLLVRGDIIHHRFFPKKNYFNYKSTYISFPISQIEKLKNFLFSLNRFNLFGLYYSDYGDKHQSNMTTWVYQILKKNNIDNIEKIVLLTHPRVLNYVFNPVSFWMCFNNKHQLIAVLSEVNNTCNQKHNYLCFKEGLEPIKSNDWMVAKKEFYVSPFMKTEGEYKFRFKISENQIAFFINYFVDQKLKLSTSLKCDFQEFNKKNLFLSFLKMPFFTLKTTILIHYQALKLWLKPIEHYSCPPPLKNNTTITDKYRKNQ